jgi:hypothetical protein
MDSGEEIAGLGEDWSFLGAKAVEWCAGLAMFIVASEVFFKGEMASSMPILLAIWISTTTSLATLRKGFPDEEKGLRNLILVSCGFEPPGIPTPADLQSVWSGAPLRDLSEKCEFIQLGLTDIFEDDEEVEDPEVNH